MRPALAPPPMIVKLGQSDDRSLVGGKAAGLARLIGAGLPVPPGFVVTSIAHGASRIAGNLRPHAELAALIVHAYRELLEVAGQAAAVAVRSSASFEDEAAASLAGQLVTTLDVDNESDLLEAIARSWASLDSPRVQAYLRARGVDVGAGAEAPVTAVLVQIMVPARVAGVLFTVDPAEGRQSPAMLVEASFGLGETVVAGAVQPDSTRIARADGAIIDERIGTKHVELLPGARAQSAVAVARQREACLNARELLRLAALGKRVEEIKGEPQDIEWAIAGDEIYLLQSRDITTLAIADERARITESIRSELDQRARRTPMPLIAHNLSETLGHPTPLTRSVIERFMSDAGGYQAAHRALGFAPAAAIARAGSLVFVGGRIYSDPLLVPLIFAADHPYAYDPRALRDDPAAATGPPTLARGSLLARRRAARRLTQIGERAERERALLKARLLGDVFPELARRADELAALDIEALTEDAFIDTWRSAAQMILCEFASAAVMPGLLAAKAIDELREFLGEHAFKESTDSLLADLTSSREVDRTLLCSIGLRAVGDGHEELHDWLDEYGHRATEELELSVPRNCERSESVQALAESLAASSDPLAMHRRQAERARARQLAIAGALAADAANELETRLAQISELIWLREEARHQWMRGFALLRLLALEAGRRLGVGDGVFLLFESEMLDMLSQRARAAPLIEITDTIATRRREREAERALVLPRVLDETTFARAAATASGAHASIMQAKSAQDASSNGALIGSALSPGVATGRVTKVRDPAAATALAPGTVLIAASTDPSWTPLVATASALIVERGGMLSHGAVVARELGLPAVALDDALTLFADGETLTVHGGRGVIVKGVWRDDSWTLHPELQALESPPPISRRERRGARATAIATVMWCAVLALIFWLPPGVALEPAFAALDFGFWPLVAGLGPPLATALIAVLVATVCLLLQKFGTDNERLLVARARARAIERCNRESVPRSKREQAKLVRGRVLLASLYPLAFLLGPLVLIFLWLPARVDPASWSAAPGTPIEIVATVAPAPDSSVARSVRLELESPLALAAGSSATAPIPAVRADLEALATALERGEIPQGLPVEMRTALADSSSAAAIRDSLSAWLGGKPEPIKLMWRILTPPDRSGRFKVHARMGDEVLTTTIVLGDRFPPEPLVVASAIAPEDAPQLIELTTIPAPPATRRIFWRPTLPVFGACEIGWLWVYIIAYLPTLFILRAILRVA